MRIIRLAFAAAVAGFIAAPVAAQTPEASSSLAPPPNAPPPHTAAPGPYEVHVEFDPTLPTHTIYRPADMSRFGGRNRLPVIAWGNGACSNAGLLFSNFLRHIASHGYVVIASGPLNAPLPAYASGRTTNPVPDGSVPTGRTNDEDLITALDWAMAQNAKDDGRFAGRLDAGALAVMGQSCGGLQATAVADDPRLKTVVIWNSGVFANPRQTAPTGAPASSLSGATKDSLRAFHTPVAYFEGGPTDSAYENGLDDFNRIDHVPAFFGSINSGHGGTYQHPGGGWFGEVGVAWLDWQLKGDRDAARWFTGANCRLCVNPIWEVKRKGM